MITFTIPGPPVGKGRPRVTVDRVRELLALDPITGEMRWRLTIGARAKAGALAGSIASNGYRTIGIDGVRAIKAHRLAWVLAFGEWPSLDIDHIDGNRSNNAIRNLRLATPAENHQNMRKGRSDNALGMLGVSPRKGRFRAQIQVDGRKKWLGEYDSAHAAQAAYLRAKRELHSHGTL